MASATFQFANHPGVVYHAVRGGDGFVQVSISAGGPPVDVCGFLVTQTPPPLEPEQEPEPPVEGGE